MTALIVLSAVAVYLAGALITARVATPRLYRGYRAHSEERYRRDCKAYPALYRDDHDPQYNYRTVAVVPARRNTRVAVFWLALGWPVTVPVAAVVAAVAWAWWTARPMLAAPRTVIIAGWRLLIVRPCSRAAEFAFRAPIRELEKK